MSFVVSGVSHFLKNVIKNDDCVLIHKLEEIWGKKYGECISEYIMGNVES